MKLHTSKTILLIFIFNLIFFYSCKEETKAISVIDSHIETGHINASGITSVLAKCPNGKQMVGGGFTISPDARVFVVGSYPVSKDTWQVDVINMSQPGEDPSSLSVYVYYYTGDKNLGMEIKQQNVVTSVPASLALFEYKSLTIEKPSPSYVVTCGGFKLSNPDIIENDVLGSFPALVTPTPSGVLDNVIGWTNNLYVMSGKTTGITNYLMYSKGSAIVGSSSTPVFDQGTALRKNSSTLGINSIGSFEMEGNTDYFCTGGGYNLTDGAQSFYYPVLQVWQNNATTKSGVFYGWQFKGQYVTTNNWDIYALQLKLH